MSSDFDRFALNQWDMVGKLPPLPFKQKSGNPSTIWLAYNTTCHESELDYQRNIPNKFMIGDDNWVRGKGLGHGKIKGPIVQKTKCILCQVNDTTELPLLDFKMDFQSKMLDPQQLSNPLLLSEESSSDYEDANPMLPKVSTCDRLDMTTVHPFHDESSRHSTKNEKVHTVGRIFNERSGIFDKSKYRELAKLVTEKARLFINNMAKNLAKSSFKQSYEDVLSHFLLAQREIEGAGLDLRTRISIMSNLKTQMKAALKKRLKSHEMAHIFKTLNQLVDEMKDPIHPKEQEALLEYGKEDEEEEQYVPIELPKHYRRLSSVVALPDEVLRGARVKSIIRMPTTPKNDIEENIEVDEDPKRFFADYQFLLGLEMLPKVSAQAPTPTKDCLWPDSSLNLVWDLFVHIKLMYDEVVGKYCTKEISKHQGFSSPINDQAL